MLHVDRTTWIALHRLHHIDCTTYIAPHCLHHIECTTKMHQKDCHIKRQNNIPRFKPPSLPKGNRPIPSCSRGARPRSRAPRDDRHARRSDLGSLGAPNTSHCGTALRAMGYVLLTPVRYRKNPVQYRTNPVQYRKIPVQYRKNLVLYQTRLVSYQVRVCSVILHMRARPKCIWYCTKRA